MLAIAERLNRQGVATRKGTQWWKAMIKKIIDNQTYCGVVYFAGVRIDLPEIALIDRATWDAAQEQRRHNREFSMRNRKHDYLLANRFRCACGETCVGSTQPNQYQRHYYRCSQFQEPPSRHHCPLDVPHVSGFVVDSLVWGFVRTLVVDEDLLRTSIEEVNAARVQTDTSTADRLSAFDVEIEAANRKIDFLVKGFGDDSDEVVLRSMKASVRETQRGRDEAKVKRAMLLNEIEELDRVQRGQADILDHLSAWRADIDQADFAFKREVFDILDVRIKLGAGEQGGYVLKVSSRVNVEKVIPYLTAPQYKKMLRLKAAGLAI